MRLNNLLAPGHIGALQLKNRIVHAPMSLGLGHGDGTCGDRFLAYYARRAKGGAGLINIGTVSVGYPEGSVDARQIAASDDKFLPSLCELAEHVHAWGAKIVLQLNHNGPQAGGDRAAGRPLAVPSVPEIKRGDLADCFLPEELVALAAGNPVLGEIKYQVLDESGIARIVTMFAAAAGRAKRAGIDAVEIHGGHGYLLAAFLSPVTNRRTDTYGGAVENRSRFLIEVLRAVRIAVGPDFPMWCKLDSEEFALEGGIRIEDAISTARLAEAAGADAISVSAYSDVSKSITHSGSHTPQRPELLVPNAIRIRQAVGIPVITAGRIGVEEADRHIAAGHFDFVAFGRKLLADPDLPAKLHAGQADHVRPCIYCYSCISQAYFRRRVLCTVNPEMGREAEAASPGLTAHKRVAVVGGGPVGMEAALRFAARGHEAVLFEKSNRLGGAFRAAAKIYGPNQDYLGWLEREVAGSSVDVRLGVEATPEALAAFNPDAVIVASGGVPTDPHAPNAETFLADIPASFDGAGSSFVMLGGGMAGLELAQFLRGRGAEVAVFDPAPKLGAGLPIVRRARVLTELREAGVTLHAGAREFAAHDPLKLIVATEPAPDTRTAEVLGAAGFRVIKAGECAGLHTLEESIRAVWDEVDENLRGKQAVDTSEKLVAIEEIKRLRARFARCLDTKQWKEMEDTITDDCVFDARDGATVTQLWVGAEDIVANIRRSLENASSVHHAHMPEIEITSSTTARGLWAMQDFLRFPGYQTVDLVGSGHYHETYEKQADGKWRLKTYQLTRLRVDITHSSSTAAAPVSSGPAPAPRIFSERTISAALVTGYGGPEMLAFRFVPQPLPGPGEILVDVAGAGVNPIDGKLRSGVLSLFMPLQFPAQLGGDVSGMVDAVGEGVTGFKPGDRVIGMINPAANGAYAETIAAPASLFTLVPEGMDLVDAAALPMGGLTGIQLIELGVKPKAGDRILVTGAAGSVGRAAVYTAAAAGAGVVAGVRASARHLVEDLPVVAVVDLADAEAVAAAGPFDAIADTVGGRVAERLCKHLRADGVLASVASPPPLPPVGSAIRLAPVWVTFDGPRLAKFVDDMMANGWTMPVAHQIPLAEAANAHALLDAGSVGGKIILVP